MNDKELTAFAPSAESGTTRTAPVTQAEQYDTPAPKHHYVADGFKNRTHGEVKFNKDTYIGVGYFGAIAASLLLTFGLKDSKLFSPQFKKITDGIANATKGNRTGEPLKRWRGVVDSYTTILSMFTGTTLMTIFPVKWLEDHKAQIVKQNDEKIYGKDRVATDSDLIAAHAEIDAAPKQTWKSIISSRVLAFVATVGTSLLIGNSASILARNSGHSIDRHSINFGRWVGKLASRNNPGRLAEIERAAAASPNGIARAEHPDGLLSRLGSYLALDAFYTVITGGALYVFTRVLAPVFDQDIRERTREERAHIHPHHAYAPVEAPPITPANRPAPIVRDADIAGTLSATPGRTATV